MANSFITNELTEVLQKLVKEVVNDPKTYRGSAYMPSVVYPVNKVRVEIIEASGGLTNDHLPGTPAKYIQSFGTRVEEFQPAFFKEAIHFDEQRILFLRELGKNDRSQRGIRQYITEATDRLNRRMEAKIEKLRWDTILTGAYSWMGKTVSFGIPAANQATPVTAVWSSDLINANASANPLKDLRYWLLGGYAPFRKYKVGKMIMNPNTARWILDNANTLSYLTSYGANPRISEYELDKILQFLVPGLPPCEVYGGWYQTESVDGNGKLNVSNAVYMIPDGYIFFEVSNLPGGDKIGEFVQTVNLADGTIDAPGAGKFLVIDDNTVPGSKGGPSNPYLDIVAGVYGSPALFRPFDTISAKVIA